MFCRTSELNADSADPDQMPQSALSDPSLHCLPVPLLGFYGMLGLTITTFWANSEEHKLIFFLIFARKQKLRFHANSICMKSQNLFSWKNKQNISKCHLLSFFTLHDKHSNLNKSVLLLIFSGKRMCTVLVNRLED